MKKIHSNGHALVQTESTLSFASFSEKEDRTYYYQYDGESVKGILMQSYIESKFGMKADKMANQLSDSNFSYIESLARGWIKEDGNSKLVSLKEYYNNTLEANQENSYEFDIVPKYTLADIAKFTTCTIQNETICLDWPHDTLLHFNEHGELVQHISLETSDYYDTLYHICSDGQFIWGVSPTRNTVVKYMFPSLKLEKIYHYTAEKSDAQEQSEINDEIRVCVSENRLSGLDYPEAISYIDGQLYICDMGNKRIVTFHPDTGKITPYIALNFSPFEFLKWKNQFVIQSNTGIYLLDQSDDNLYRN